jgi:hypothetical protein
LGAALGSAATGQGGATGSSGRLAEPQRISIERLIVDPNATQRQRASATASRSVAVANPPAPQVVEVIGIDTPRGQQLIGTSNARYQRRQA